MCKLVRAKSEVLSLAEKARYVNEVFQKAAVNPPETKDMRLRLHIMDAR